MAYDALLSYKEDKNVNIVVIYSSDIKKATTSINICSIKYDIKAFYMYNFDVDKTLEKLKLKIRNGEKLTKQDIISFGFLPLMEYYVAVFISQLPFRLGSVIMFNWNSLSFEA